MYYALPYSYHRLIRLVVVATWEVNRPESGNKSLCKPFPVMPIQHFLLLTDIHWTALVAKPYSVSQPHDKHECKYSARVWDCRFMSQFLYWGIHLIDFAWMDSINQLSPNERYREAYSTLVINNLHDVKTWAEAKVLFNLYSLIVLCTVEWRSILAIVWPAVTMICAPHPCRLSATGFV